MRCHPGRHVFHLYHCKECGKEMNNPLAIQSHMRKVHRSVVYGYVVTFDVVSGADGPPKCLLCSEEFALYATLLLHIKKKHGESGMDRHTAEGVLLVDDCHVAMETDEQPGVTMPQVII